ncbi:MAG: hypothetical protein HQM08_15935 [Candidatus Riflebacteria bacterium]|nr:hypothetical protein [Candidatus Riflebacteria bacterium]
MILVVMLVSGICFAQATSSGPDEGTQGSNISSGTGSFHGEHHHPPMTEAVKAAMEAKIKAWATDQGYTTETDANGRLIVKDKSGNIVKPFGGPGGHGGLGGQAGQQPTAEQKAAFEAKIKAWATEQGYTTETDANGNLVVKDQSGNVVKPFGGHGGHGHGGHGGHGGHHGQGGNTQSTTATSTGN